MNDEDREELMWRRISEKVADGVDKQIRTRYFWAALLFAGVSWFGGAALLTSIVNSRVAEKVEPAQAAVVQEKLLADQLSESLKEAQKIAKTLTDSLKEINSRLDEASKNEKNFEQQAGSAVAGFNERIKLLVKAVGDLDVKQNSKVEYSGQLVKPQVVIRIGGDVPSQIVNSLIEKFKNVFSTTTVEGGRVFVGSSGLRFFHKDDEPAARDAAKLATDVLRQFGIDNKEVPIVNLSGSPIRPPEYAFELWLNDGAWPHDPAGRARQLGG